MKIAFTGAQGVGKTTLLDILEKCFEFKLPFKFIRNLTRDIAKKGYGINENGNGITQELIMKAHKELLNSSYDIVVDRCVLDAFIYTLYFYRQGKVSKEVLSNCEDVFREYINKYDYIFYIKPEFPITGDDYRSAEINYQNDIAALFEEIIKEYNIPVISLTGTVGTRLATVLSYLKDNIK